MKKKTFYIRLAFSTLFMLIVFAGAGAQVWLNHLCRQGKIAYMQGFLTGIPIAIVMFWGACFFDDCSLSKAGGKKTYIIKRLPRRLLGTLFTLLCAGSVVFWLYVYHTNIARLF